MASPPHTDGSMVFARWQCASPPNTCFLRPIQVQIPNGILMRSAIFAQLTTVSLYSINGPPLFSHKIALLEGSRPHLIHGSLGPPESSIQTTYRSVQPSLTDRQIDRQTDHATQSVTIGCIYVHSTAMPSTSIVTIYNFYYGTPPKS